VPATVSDGRLELVARRLRVLGDPTRLRILALLQEREATVKELADELATTHQNISKHLTLLHLTGVVARRKDGNWVRYAVADYAACRMVEHAGAGVTAYAEELAETAGLRVAAAQQ
jgi:DNA-binding transcriptional ArsR family regulator